MEKLISVAVMRASDAAEIAGGTDSKTLMYRAGLGLFQSWDWHGKIDIVTGSGNNAGDGYVLALLLRHPGRPLSLEGAHCFGHNRHSIGICYEGGLDGKGLPQDTRTPAQKAALTQLLQELGRQFPASLTVGHCDLNPQKACPSFDAVKEYKGHLSAVTLRSGVGLFL